MVDYLILLIYLGIGIAFNWKVMVLNDPIFSKPSNLRSDSEEDWYQLAAILAVVTSPAWPVLLVFRLFGWKI